jgi:hypothetical protein
MSTFVVYSKEGHPYIELDESFVLILFMWWKNRKWNDIYKKT